MSKWVRNKSGILVPNREAGFIQPGIGLMNKKQGGSGGDPYWANVVSLLHFDGTNNSTIIVDETGRAWNPCVSPTVISTTNQKFGNASLRSFGPANGYIITSSSIPAVATADFTIEFFYNPFSVNTGIMVDTRTPSIYNPVIYTNGATLTYFTNNAGRIIGPSLINGAWVHIAVSRNSGNSRMYVNGTQVGIVYSDSVNITAGQLVIGAGYTLGNQPNGYMDEFRYTIGIGRYTTNFVPPSAAFPNHA